jgi:hypothetical protein
MIVQLNPMLPVTIIDKGAAYAFAMIDYSQEHDLLFVCAMQETGQIWCISNRHVRLQMNVSMGRIFEPKGE